MRQILFAATAFLLMAGGAYAQTSNSGSNSTTTVNTGAQSTSVSNPRVNVIGNPIGNGASSSVSGSRSNSNSRSNSRSAAVGNVTNVYTGGNGSGSGTNGANGANAVDPAGPAGANGTNGSAGGGDPTINYTGGYTVRNTPEVMPPSVVGGNACAVGASGGVSLPGFGVAMGATWADRACERRQQAALMYNMGEQKIAFELMCQDKNVHDAMLAAGKPCAADVAAPAPQVATAPAPVLAAPVPVVAKAPPAPKPEWCTRAKPDTEASKAYVAQMCGV